MFNRRRINSHIHTKERRDPNLWNSIKPSRANQRVFYYEFPDFCVFNPSGCYRFLPVTWRREIRENATLGSRKKKKKLWNPLPRLLPDYWPLLLRSGALWEGGLNRRARGKALIWPETTLQWNLLTLDLPRSAPQVQIGAAVGGSKIKTTSSRPHCRRLPPRFLPFSFPTLFVSTLFVAPH